MKRVPLSILLMGIILMMLCGCESVNDENMEQSPVRTSLISGKLLRPDGKTPAIYVPVTVQPAKTVADIVGNGCNKRTGVLTVTTDEQGYFAITSLDTGTYVLEGVDNERNAVRIDNIVVASAQDPFSLPDATLKRPGAVQGTVIVENGGSPESVFILAFGSDRFTQVSDNGTFLFENIPEGVYDLNFVCILDGFVGRKLDSVSVVSDDTTTINDITIGKIELCIPQNVSLVYDTLKQGVLLEWTTCSSSYNFGYNVFRRDCSVSNTYDIKKPLNGDTSISRGEYLDRDFLSDKRYEYRIAAVANDGSIGTMSSPVDFKSVKGSYLTTVDTLTDRIFFDVTTNAKGEIIAALPNSNSGAKRIDIVWYRITDYTIRRTTTLNSHINLGVPWKYGCRVDDADNIYIFPIDEDDSLVTQIIVFNADGEKQFSIPLPEWIKGWCDVIDNIFYAVGHMRSEEVVVLRLNGMNAFDTLGIFNEQTIMNNPESGLKFLPGVRDKLGLLVTDFGLYVYNPWGKEGYNDDGLEILRIADVTHNRITIAEGPTVNNSVHVVDFEGTTVFKQFFEDYFWRAAYISDERLVLSLKVWYRE